MPRPKKMSAAAARRLRAERASEKAAPAAPLSAEQQATLDRFSPHSLSPEEWAKVRPVVLEMMRRTKVRGRRTFPQLLSDVTLYVAWCLRQDKPMVLQALLVHALVEEWVREGLAELDDTTKNTRRSRLRSLASDLNPGPGAPPRAKPIERAAVKPPYTPTEVAAILRLVQTQPSLLVRRQLCVMAGLGLGAGLDSVDLRPLTRGDVDDRGGEGIWVTVAGSRPRQVPVRRRYEDLVRRGLAGLRPGDLLLGRDAHRKNVTAGIVHQAVVLGDAPHIEQARFRSTWLTELMSAAVPLSLVLAAAGLTRAGTLTDLLPYAAMTQSGDELRGEVH